MTTQPQAENDVYKRRRSVEHQDGSNEEFWETAYFIPGISGKARCLSNTDNGDLIITSRKDENSREEKINHGHARKWGTPSASRSKEEGVPKEIKSVSSSSSSSTKERSAASSSSSSRKKAKETEDAADDKVKEQTIEKENAPVGNAVDVETKDTSKEYSELKDALQQHGKKTIKQSKKSGSMPNILKTDGGEKKMYERASTTGRDVDLLSPVEEELKALLKSMRESRG